MGKVEILHEDTVLRMGLLKNLVLPAWFNAPEAQHIRAMGRALLLASSRYKKQFAVLNTIVSGTPVFADDMREELLKLMRDDKLQGLGAAHVLVVGGLTGAASRAFLNTIFLVSRAPSPNRVFGDPKEAAPWLLGRLAPSDQGWSVEELLTAHAEVAFGTRGGGLTMPPPRAGAA